MRSACSLERDRDEHEAALDLVTRLQAADVAAGHAAGAEAEAEAAAAEAEAVEAEAEAEAEGAVAAIARAGLSALSLEDTSSGPYSSGANRHAMRIHQQEPYSTDA